MLYADGFLRLPGLTRARASAISLALIGTCLLCGNRVYADEGDKGANSQLEAGGNIKQLNVNNGNTKDLSDALKALNAPRESDKSSEQAPTAPDEAGAAAALNAEASAEKSAIAAENTMPPGTDSVGNVNPDAVHPSWLQGRWSVEAACKGGGSSTAKGQILNVGKNTAEFGVSVHCSINSISDEKNNEIIAIYKCSEKKRSSQEVHRFAHLGESEIQLDGYDKWYRCK